MKTTAEILDILHDFKAHYAEKYGIITFCQPSRIRLIVPSKSNIATLIFV